MVIVFGSINVDITTRVDHLPAAGETVRGSDSSTTPGGKGANQALAARRMGAPVLFVGAVGNDAFARDATSLLREAGVDLSHLAVSNGPTGVAIISVDENGENCIVLSPGANAAVKAATLESVSTAPGDILLVQYETPSDETHAALNWARRRNLTTILNLAPAFAIPPATLGDVDILITNEVECQFLADALAIVAEPRAFVAAVAQKFDLTAVVTLGADGVVAHDGRRSYSLTAFPVTVVDTTGAGDAFVGALAATLGEHASLAEALRIASAAGALACTKPGAQLSLPDHANVLAFSHQFDVTPI